MRKNWPTVSTDIPSVRSTGCGSARSTLGPTTRAATRMLLSSKSSSIGWKRPEETEMSATDPHAHDHDHDHPHDHGHNHHAHNHPHDPIEVSEGASEYEIMVHAIKELLIEKGVITGEDIRRTLEFMDTRIPALGAKVVARAWTDPE